MFVSTTIKNLEKSCIPLTESVALISQFESNCKKVGGQIGTVVLNKFNSVAQNNTGFQILKNMSKIFMGENDVNIPNLELNIICKYKYAPITSVDVERSFSISKHMLSDKRKFPPRKL